MRNVESRPLVAAMKAWLEQELGRIPRNGRLAQAIRYALTRWPALSRFLDDGRIELDNNSVERAIRPVALGRKNHLFAGSDGGGDRWAVVASLLATAQLNNVEPFAYLRDVLERMLEGRMEPRRRSSAEDRTAAAYHIGGLIPSFSAVTRPAERVPSSFLNATMKIAAPGFSRLVSAEP